MSSSELIQKTIADHNAVVADFEAACSESIARMGELTIECLKNDGKICFFGNGGSAADSQHLAAEFVVRFVENRVALASIAFTTDTSILTACANDFGYDEVFARQVEGLCRPDDIVVGISTSGTSANVVRGLEKGREMGLTTFAFTGADGKRCGELADESIAVPSPVTARVQECHIIAGHILCDIVEQAFLDR